MKGFIEEGELMIKAGGDDNIPIALYPATRTEELKFRLLRASDHSPVSYKRVAEAAECVDSRRPFC